MIFDKTVQSVRDDTSLRLRLTVFNTLSCRCTEQSWETGRMGNTVLPPDETIEMINAGALLQSWGAAGVRTLREGSPPHSSYDTKTLHPR